MPEDKVKLTKEGYAQLDQEYRHLIDVERPEVIEQLVQARSQGDLSENADYDAARNKQAQIERRIAELEHIRDVCEIIDDVTVGKKNINLGYLVTVKDEKGNIFDVRIVGTIEANPFDNPPSVSDQSAVGKALIGRNVGDKVIVECDDPYDLEIVEAKLWQK